ncbi:unnamed protein product, partial [Sphacelaria rigidula]
FRSLSSGLCTILWHTYVCVLLVIDVHRAAIRVLFVAINFKMSSYNSKKVRRVFLLCRGRWSALFSFVCMSLLFCFLFLSFFSLRKKQGVRAFVLFASIWCKSDPLPHFFSSSLP